MDRTRRARSGRSRGERRAQALIVAGLAFTGCRVVTGNPDRIIAIEITGTTSPTVEEADTLRLAARALAAGGGVVDDAPIRWAGLDTGTVGFSIDSTGLISALQPGTGRVQARIENLRTDPIQVTVSPAPDTVAISGAARFTFTASDAQSQPLTTLVSDLTTSPGLAMPLSGKRVEYVVIEPIPGSPAGDLFFLAVGTATTPGVDLHRVSAMTSSAGQAAVYLHRTGAAHPADSTIIEATALTARGAPVAGSPIRFVVVFN